MRGQETEQPLLALLSENGVIGQQDAVRVARMAELKRERVSTILNSLGLVSSHRLAQALSEISGVSLCETTPEIDQGRLNDLETGFLRAAGILPLVSEGERICWAIVDPTDRFHIEALSMKYGREFDLKIVPTDQMNALLDLIEENRQSSSENSGALQGDDADVIVALEDLASREPVVLFLNEMLRQAHDRNASDIHIECDGERYLVRLRIDSFLMPYDQISLQLGAGVVSRLKILAKMDISEQRLPQDGRYSLSLNGKPVDLRISSIPAIFGEGVVIRLLDKSGGVMPLRKLGYEPAQQKRMEHALHRPDGIILLTGPTGCGKSTTLYSLLSRIISPDRKIITVEDPVEYQLEGLMQVPVRSQIGLDFGAVLRSVLRHDPDVLMIGEIRDVETAQIAIRASMTGHLVLSSLHANSAVASATRLLDMGLEHYLVASTLSMVVAQRLLRRLCLECKKPVQLTPENLDLHASKLRLIDHSEISLFEASGCSACDGTGYFGRIAVAEILEVNDRIRAAIAAGETEAGLARMATEGGMKSLMAEGMELAARGITSLDEVYRVLGDMVHE